MDEIEEVIKNKVLKEQTKKTYRDWYRKLSNTTGKLRNTPEDYIFSVINQISNDKVSNKLAYINIAIMVKQHYKEPVDFLLKKREKFYDKRDEQQAEIKFDLPDYIDVFDYVEKLSGLKYIVNYLIFNYGVRNKDVNVFITQDEKLTKKDTTKNYLLVKPNVINYIINDYKTVETYGPKKIQIKFQKFRDELMKLQMESKLLNVEDSSLNNTISRMLYVHNGKHMTEGSYFKLNIKHLQTKKNSLKKIQKLAINRGTDIETVSKYYDVN